NFCVASVLGSSCTTCTLRSCAPYAPINSSKYLCLERSLIFSKFNNLLEDFTDDLGRGCESWTGPGYKSRT
ncbi:MAG: hypothetical protein LBJ16_00400, partial [Holosporaceae bacterium]|nr:hypothetical protein [Holosporaceae bacterium]